MYDIFEVRKKKPLMTQRSLLWKNLRRKYGRPILKLSYWKSSLRSQIFLCTSTSLVFNEEGTYVESTGRRYKIPKEQYQMIWIHLKFSLKGDLEYDIASQWYISEKCFSKFLFFFFFVSWMLSQMPQFSYCCISRKL